MIPATKAESWTPEQVLSDCSVSVAVRSVWELSWLVEPVRPQP